MKKIICLILLFCSLSTLSQTIDNALLKAYKYNSKVILDEFFMNWQKSNELNNDEEAKVKEQINSNETLKTVIEIANSFYKSIYIDSTYFIVSDTIAYCICNADSVIICEMNISKKSGKQQLAPYRLPVFQDKILYPNEKYINSLNEYFKNNYDYNDYGNMEEKLKDYEAKKNFLSAKVTFRDKPGFSKSNYFHFRYIYSKPKLGTITINNLLSEAVLFIQADSQSFFTELWIKENGHWLAKKVLTEGGF